jgi:hypothetical protein
MINKHDRCGASGSAARRVSARRRTPDALTLAVFAPLAFARLPIDFSNRPLQPAPSIGYSVTVKQQETRVAHR